ncbi:Sugar phosphate isomerase/epimerase [Caldanaerobius fijiensis DSM 17918]|uniref:Sugar phosphate isomerase/epimerase n=1 Tax=Caldanaerobius fijiensis DSM 17918 TaxID=1121256 RepID=A0A1M5CRJ8_9THEO|nr:sugar phosphate isomerase/epimerase family protein [Caldanaerobius fijiensis]SHF57333.1 Sugar phosphate isomerase/epimerase [Caldanaerobius fijiensis DSM 17918]
MIKSAFCYIFKVEDFDQAVAKLASLGYDGVELWPQVVEVIPIEHIKEMLDANKIACAQICPYFNFVEGKELWDKSMEIASRYIDYAVKLGNPLIRVFTGRVWGGPAVGAHVATEEQWSAAIEGIKKICDMAAPHGLRLALECHRGTLMEDSPSALRLLREVDKPNLGLNLQLPLLNEDVDYSVEQVGKYTIHMHANNWSDRESMGQDKNLTFVRDGVIDYNKVIRRLLKLGFDGYVSIEHANHAGAHDPWLTAEVDGAYLNELKSALNK